MPGHSPIAGGNLQLSERSNRRDYIWPSVILGGPVVVVCVLLFVRILTSETITCELRNDWGNIASVWGLAIGIYVLVVATGARRAAEEARLRSKRLSLTVELEATAHKVQEVGHFLSTGNWEVVRIRSEEISNTCQAALGEWSDDPLRKKTRDRLILAAKIMRSIAERSATVETNPPTADERKETKAAQLRVSELLNTVLGESRGLQEKE
jgi:hypothetical protein